MPRKICELINDLERDGFINRSGKGSHRNFVYLNRLRPLTVSSNSGNNAQPYQEQLVKKAIMRYQMGEK